MPYRTGYAEGVLHDDARSDWDDLLPRPVAWACWYPVAEGAGIGTGRRRSDTGGTPSPFVQADLIRDGILSDASREWPLVLLSHGTGGSAGSLSWLADGLARSGHVCIGVNHHGNTATEPFRAEGFLCWWERASDLSLVLDRLDEIPRLAGRVDRSRIGVVGFSLGSHTALALAGAVTSMDRFERWRSSSVAKAADGPREFPDLAAELSRLNKETGSARFLRSWKRHGDLLLDPRVTRYVAVAPAPPVRAFTPRSLTGIACPVLLLAGEADTEAPYDECAAWLAGTNPDFVLHSMGEHVGHYTFLPECTAYGRELEPMLCRDHPSVSRAKVHDETVSAVRLFMAVDGTPNTVRGLGPDALRP